MQEAFTRVEMVHLIAVWRNQKFIKIPAGRLACALPLLLKELIRSWASHRAFLDHVEGNPIIDVADFRGLFCIAILLPKII
jgi:hypothetical protein